MKAYLITTAALFALLTGVHAWRMVVERHLATDPWFLGMTLLSTGLCAWALVLLGRTRAQNQ